VIPTSRTGLPWILRPMWDDPHAGEASNGRRALFPFPPPTLTPTPAWRRARSGLKGSRTDAPALIGSQRAHIQT